MTNSTTIPARHRPLINRPSRPLVWSVDRRGNVILGGRRPEAG